MKLPAVTCGPTSLSTLPARIADTVDETDLLMAAFASSSGLSLIWHRRDLRLDDNALYRDAGRPLSVPRLRPGHVRARAVVRAARLGRDAHRAARGAAAPVRRRRAASVAARSRGRARGAVRRPRFGPSRARARARRRRGALARRARRARARHLAARRGRGARARRRARASRPPAARCTTRATCRAVPTRGFGSRTRGRSRARRGRRRAAAAGRDDDDDDDDGLAGMPRVLNDWRRAARAHTRPRAPLPTARELRAEPLGDGIEAGELPTLAELMAPALAAGGRPLFGLPDEVIRRVVDDAEASDADGAGEGARARARARRRRRRRGGARGRRVARRGGPARGRELAARRAARARLRLAATGPRRGPERRRERRGAWLASHMEMRDFFLFSAFAAGPALFRRDGWLPVAARRPKGAGAGAALPGAVARARDRRRRVDALGDGAHGPAARRRGPARDGRDRVLLEPRAAELRVAAREGPAPRLARGRRVVPVAARRPRGRGELGQLGVLLGRRRRPEAAALPHDLAGAAPRRARRVRAPVVRRARARARRRGRAAAARARRRRVAAAARRPEHADHVGARGAAREHGAAPRKNRWRPAIAPARSAAAVDFCFLQPEYARI